MILCLNANAAIDRTILVPGFRLGQIHRPERVLLLPGGKGINVARGLHTLGEEPRVAGWAGGFAGQFIAAGLGKEGIPADFTWCDFESRTCLSILDPLTGELTELYETGEPVPPSKMKELKEQFSRLLRGAAWVALSGSLAPGVPAGFYADLLEQAAAAGVSAALDCRGELLRLGLERGRPLLVKPNLVEFEELLGCHLEGLERQCAAALDAARRYDVTILLSLGAQGALAACGGEAWQAVPPPVPIASAVGSGDALLAGVIHGLTRAHPVPEALRRGVAAGTANALTLGAGRFTRAEFDRILSGVQLRRLS
jgi:tagatose 6-phosphate kinase